ncbi:hypothetical protein DMENIID0001_045870 [Sergentomyia squamirostris]
MNTWIHCNNCYLYFAEDRTFYMQNCSHIMCASCLKKTVIANGNMCKFCNRPVKYKKIGREMDPKIRECFDLRQNLKIEAILQGLKLSDVQFKHMTNRAMLKRMTEKIRTLMKLKKKLFEKNEAMKKYVDSVKRSRARKDSVRSSGRDFFVSSQVTVQREPLLKIGSSGYSSSSRGSSGSTGSPASFVRSQKTLANQPKKTDFKMASSVMRAEPSRKQPPAGLPIKRHPQITRLSKISAQASEFARLNSRIQ